MSVFGLGDLAFLGAAGGGLWTPANITTALWLDAADSSTVTASSGLVSQINDKSGNGRNFTSSGSLRPTYTSGGLNGNNVLTVSGAHSLSAAPPASDWTFMHNGQASAYLVAKFGNTSDPNVALFLLHTRTSGVVPGFYFFYEDRAPTNDALGYDSGNGSRIYNPTPSGFCAANSPAQVSFVLDSLATPATNRSEIRVNGGLPAKNNSSTAATLASDPAYPLTIGYADAAGPLGYVGEVIVSSVVHDTMTRQRIEGYLAHKWGLTASLPSDHPYKTAPPTV